MDPSPTQLIKHLNAHYPDAKYSCVYEAGFGGFWIQEQLKALGVDCLVAHVNDIPTTDKDRTQKTDSNDSKKLARELERGGITGIYVPSQDHQMFRTLCRTYYQAVKDSTRIKCRIKGMINFYGIETPKHSSHWPNHFITYLRELSLPKESLKQSMDLQLDDLIHQRMRKVKTLRHIKQYLKNEQPYLLKRIQSIPGIGFKSAMTLISEIWDMNRFENLDKLKAYVGLIPSTHSTGDTIREGQLTHRRNKFLRKILVESAWVAIRRDKVLMEAHFKMCARMKSQQSITRIAKKLLSRLRAVWLNDQDNDLL